MVNKKQYETKHLAMAEVPHIHGNIGDEGDGLGVWACHIGWFTKGLTMVKYDELWFMANISTRGLPGYQSWFINSR